MQRQACCVVESSWGLVWVPASCEIFVTTDSKEFPAKPIKLKSAVASVSFTLARNTNIDKRFTVWAIKSRRHTNNTSSGLGLQYTKLPCIRPFALQKAPKWHWSAFISKTSWVSWLWRKLAASSPEARITPKWGRGATPSRTGKWESVDISELSCPTYFGECLRFK